MKKADTTKLLAGIIEYFQKNYSIINSGKENIKLNSTTQTAPQFTKRFEKEQTRIADFVGKVDFVRLTEFLKEEKRFRTDEQVNEFMADKVFTHLKKGVSKEAKAKFANVLDKEIIKHSFDWSSHFPILDIKTKKQMMYDSKHKILDHATSHIAWTEYLKGVPSESRAHALGMAISGVVTYNPYDIEEIQYKPVGKQEEVVHVNAHRTPKWRKTDIESKGLPKEFIELMDHLLPGKKCQEYVYHWMNFMMTSRNHCYLLLHGEQGIGKNTLASVMEKLVGYENYSYVGPSFWDDDKFNSELRHKRLVFFDETVVGRGNLTSIRSFTNKYIAITEKGVDTIMYDNHCSYVIANNLDKINKITFDDRRYSVPVLGKEPIKNALGTDWLDKFYELIEDEEFIGRIGHWILQHGDTGDFNEKQPYLTEYFYDIVDKALTQWQATIINLIETKEYDEINLEGIKDQLGDPPPGRVKVSGFLDSHRDREGDSYGRVAQNSDKERVIKVSKKYWPDHAIEFESVDDTFDGMEF